MWKSGFCLTAATTFYPQAIWENEKVFHRLCGKVKGQKFSTGYHSTFHRRVWINDTIKECHSEPVRNTGVGISLMFLLTGGLPRPAASQ